MFCESGLTMFESVLTLFESVLEFFESRRIFFESVFKSSESVLMFFEYGLIFFESVFKFCESRGGAQWSESHDFGRKRARQTALHAIERILFPTETFRGTARRPAVLKQVTKCA
jgi:hypothetical protein